MNKEEDIKNIVIEGYRDILKREPDPGGLANYINEIKKGLSIERFHDILRSSDEYRELFNPFVITSSKEVVSLENDMYIQNISPIVSTTTTQSLITLTYCMMGLDRLYEIKSYIEAILPYIDRFIFIDGGSTDGTIKYLQSINSRKLEIYTYKWKDDFSGQRNNYLRHFADKQNNGWILVSDTDEHFPIDTLSKLKDEIVIAESGKYNGIKIRAYDIIIDDNDPDKIVHEEFGIFWKPLLFKYHPSIYYEGGGAHETLKGNIIWKQIDLIYKHTRSKRKIHERAVQNFWVSSSNSQIWLEFRLLCTKNNILKFSDFFEQYKKGILSKDIEDWIYDHINYNEDSEDLECTELRDTAKFYFEILHPDKKLLYQN